MTKRRKRALLGLVILSGVLFLVGRFIITPTIVWGDSMSPTLKNWDLCLIWRYQHYTPQRGDIVIFRTVDDPPLLFVKRVIGVTGESVAIEHGKVLINGALLAEPYTSPNSEWSLAPTNIPTDRIYVIGDNRDVSMDLAIQGIVATRLVKGRVAWHWRWRS